jgi:signal transduction histidine kinase
MVIESEHREAMLSLAHDLRNPLTAIKGYAEALHRHAAASAVDRDAILRGLEIIDAETARLDRYISALSDAGSLPAELYPGPRSLTDLVQLARQAVELFGRQHPERRIVLRTTAPRIQGHWDAVSLERAIHNVVDNAHKFSAEGEPITVVAGRAHVADSTDSWAYFSVRDEGVGIPKDDLPRIFDWFHRGENVRGRVPGSGIGLASVRAVVEQHQGTIAVSSEEGVGTTITLRLPLREE